MGDAGRFVAALLIPAQQRRNEVMGSLGEESLVPGFFHIFTDGPGKPKKIVRAAGADALVPAVLGMPPVHDVALLILVRAGVNYTAAGKGRINHDHIHRVLKLVAEAKGAAALIDGAPPQKPASHGLIRRPAVHITIQLRIGGADAQTPGQPGPVFPDAPEGRHCRLRLSQGPQVLQVGAAADDHKGIRTGDHGAEAGQQPRPAGAVGLPPLPRGEIAGDARGGSGKNRCKRLLRIGRAGVERGEGVVRVVCDYCFGVSIVSREQQFRAPIDLRRRALDDQNPGGQIHGYKSGGFYHRAADIFFPYRRAETEGDAAFIPVLGGEKAHAAALVKHRQGFGAGGGVRVVQPGGYPALPRVLIPHVSRAGVRGDKTEGSACKQI